MVEVTNFKIHHKIKLLYWYNLKKTQIQQGRFSIQNIPTKRLQQLILTMHMSEQVSTVIPEHVVSMIFSCNLEFFQSSSGRETHSSPQHLNIPLWNDWGISGWVQQLECLLDNALAAPLTSPSPLTFLSTSETSVSASFYAEFYSLLLLQLYASCILFLPTLNCSGCFFALTILRCYCTTFPCFPQGSI